MSKAKLVLRNTTVKKVASAAHFSGVTVDSAIEIAGEIVAETSFKTPQELIEFARKLDKVTGDELEQLNALTLKKAEAAAAAAAKTGKK